MTEIQSVLIFTQLVLTVMADTGAEHLTSFVGVTFKECFQQCKHRLSCGSILYKHRLTYCKLYGQYLSNYRLGIRKPGVVYREKIDWNEELYPSVCNGRECIPGEKCKDTCDLSECPIPTEGHEEIQMLGNLRHTGSKIQYQCKNHFTGPVYSTCTWDGSWLPVTFSCDTHAYSYVGANTYRSYRYNLTDKNQFSLQSEYLDTCLSRCNKTTRCLGVNYSPETKICESTNLQTNLGNINHALSTRIGWTHYYKILPISMHANGGNSYRFTFEEGHSFCELSMGTTMASLTDLELASSMGFSSCTCGWTTSKSAFLSNWFSCGGRKHGVSHCWDMVMSDVFWKDKRFRSD